MSTPQIKSGRLSESFLIFLVLLVVLPSFASAEETYKFERMWPTLQQPWYFNQTGEIAVDSSGNVYVADVDNYRIQKFTSDGQFLTMWGSEGTADGQFNEASGITVGSDGTIYVADTLNHRIQKFTSHGTFITSWGSEGSGDGEFNQPASITLDSSGNIYVADTLNNRIQKFTADGLFATKWGQEGTGNGEFNLPESIAVDAAGKVYVSDAGNFRVQKFTSSGTFITTWGSEGSGDGQFGTCSVAKDTCWFPSGPKGIAIDLQGTINVADPHNHRIQNFSTGGTFISSWWEEEYVEDDLPRDIAIDTGGNCYVTDINNNSVVKFTPGKRVANEWKSYGDRQGVFDLPTGIELDTSDNIYVVDTWNHRIQKFTTEGELVTEWGSFGTDKGQLDQPYGIAVDTSGNVYVADTGNDRIQKFTSGGTFITKWGSEGDGNGQFIDPLALAIDSSDNLYVVDSQNHRVQKFTAEGTYITEWGSECNATTGEGCVDPDGNGPLEQGDGAFNSPWGVALDASNNVYVVDTKNNRIQKFTTDGEFLDKWGSEGWGDGEFFEPVGIAIDSGGDVYVVDRWNYRIQRFTAEGKYISEWGSHGSSPGQVSDHVDLAFGADDKMYLTEGGNNRIQVLKKVTASSNNKAIIVAGGGPYAGNSLWGATQMCTNFAYRTLTYQGFTKESITYLTSDKGLDLDNNGVADDVDGEVTKTNLDYAITDWGKSADNLLIYFTDHGGKETFRMDETETLSSSDLLSWLDEINESITEKAIVIYDACESGSFIDDLSGDDRIIITSTLPDEKAKFLNQGTISFSGFFWAHIFDGLSIEDAFTEAKQNINFAFENQNPQLEGDAENVYIGNAVENMVGDAPEIGSVSPPQEIYIFGSAELYADTVTDPDDDDISRVWAVIWPPDYTPGPTDDPLLSLPTVDLQSAGGGRYQGTYTDFSTDGTYQIAIYAMDSNNNTSIPKVTTVSRNYHVSRKAIIVAGVASETVTRQMIEKNAGLAYDSLKSQLYTDSDIYFMSVTGIEDFDAAPSLFYLEIYLSSLLFDITTGNLDLTIYLVGEGDEETFKLSDSEILTVSDLDGWLDTLQSVKPGRVTLIYDAGNSGSFIPGLVPPAGKERILITSTSEDGTTYFNEEGATSFSSFFFSQVSSGATLYDAFAYAKKALSYLSRRGEISFSCYKNQTPLLEADGNSVANEEADYEIARDITIGVGMKFADDPPQIGSVSASETGGVVTIAAEDITATGTLKRVWAVIKPIGYCPENSAEETGDLTEVELTDPDGDGRYEGTYSDRLNAYKINVYAMDTDSSTSLPKETRIYQEGGLDIYEVDDTRAEANVIVINHTTPQPHNFHAANDEDWVKFYGLKDISYIIKATNLEADCRPTIELYYENDAEPTEVENLIVENSVSIEFDSLKDGIYYATLFNGTEGEETGYDLQVDNADAPGLLVLITGRIKDQISREGIDGAFISTDGGGSFISLGGRYDLYQKPGSWTIEVSADGYMSYFEGISIDAGDQIISKDIILDPTGVSTTTTTVDQSASTTTVTICPQEVLYGEHSDKTEFLRYFRDSILSQTQEGREIIRLYYEWSPVIVTAMEEDEEFKKQVKTMIDGILVLIGEEIE